MLAFKVIIDAYQLLPERPPMSATRKTRFMISLDKYTEDLLNELQEYTNLSPAQTIQKLLPSHLEELHTYLAWLKQPTQVKSLKSQLGPFLLHSYGPESLIEGIKKLDPTYETEADKFGKNLAE